MSTSAYDARSRWYNDLYYEVGEDTRQKNTGGHAAKYSIMIDLLTDGDFTTKSYDPIPFHPTMTSTSAPFSSALVLFIPIVELHLDDIRQLKGFLGDPKVYFTNTDLFLKLLRSVLKDSSRYVATYEDITQNTPAFKQIIQNNLELLKQVFFPDQGEGLLTIMGQPYKIRSAEVLARTFKAEKINSRNPVPLPVRYYVTFKLHLLNAARDEPFKNRTCEESATDIDNTCQKLFGRSCGFRALEKLPPLPAKPPPVLHVSANLGPAQQDWERRNGVQQRSDFRTAAEEKMIRILRDLDHLDQQHQKINTDWLAETEATEATLNDLADQIKTNDAQKEEWTEKYMQKPTSSYFPIKLAALEEARGKLVQSQASAQQQLDDIDKKYTETLTESVQETEQEIKGLEAKLVELQARLQTVTDPTERITITQEMEKLSKTIEPKLFVASRRSLRNVDEWRAVVNAIKEKKLELDELKGRQVKDEKTQLSKETKQKVLLDIGAVQSAIDTINYKLKPTRKETKEINVKELLAEKQKLLDQRMKLFRKLQKMIPDTKDLVQQLDTVNVTYSDLQPEPELDEYQGGSFIHPTRRRFTKRSLYRRFTKRSLYRRSNTKRSLYRRTNTKRKHMRRRL